MSKDIRRRIRRDSCPEALSGQEQGVACYKFYLYITRYPSYMTHIHVVYVYMGGGPWLWGPGRSPLSPPPDRPCLKECNYVNRADQIGSNLTIFISNSINIYVSK